MLKAIKDSDIYVAAEAAHALCYLGHTDIGASVLVAAFSKGDRAAFSALETLALTPIGKRALLLHQEVLHQLARLNETLAPVGGAGGGGDGEGNEEGGKGWQARAILVNLGTLPVGKLYGVAEQKEGREINSSRKPLRPKPNVQPKVETP
ncbi:hypothetical protein EON80_25490 [bacterium]|nr:MAG: hypothetical protein EON80_25490 [bacterium]